MVQIGGWPPPREWGGTSQVFRAQPRGYHWIFVPDPRDYHWIFVPDPGAITGYLFPTLGAITGYLFPTLGISPILPLKKWYARGGMVNHRFEPHIRRPAGRTRNFDFLVAVFGIFKENRGMFLCNPLRPTRLDKQHFFLTRSVRRTSIFVFWLFDTISNIFILRPFLQE